MKKIYIFLLTTILVSLIGCNQIGTSEEINKSLDRKTEFDLMGNKITSTTHQVGKVQFVIWENKCQK